MKLRTDWSREEVKEIWKTPLLDLIFKSGQVHRVYHPQREVQVCTLLSIKTGGCPENCGYCAQSSRYQTGLEREKLHTLETVIEKAKEAKKGGASRFCLGAGWRGPRDGQSFDRVIEMVKEVNKLGMEVCCTLGMLSQEQADRLKEAGLFAYNHNLDTSEAYYPKVVTTRTYQDRLETLEKVRKAGISVCCGGILGLGESEEDRIDLLHTLATLPEHPESVPINALEPISGTPMENNPPVSSWEMIRMVAVARILMPKSMIRLTAGREKMSGAEQALCFLAGANSIFSGPKLLTVSNCEFKEDESLFEILGLLPKPIPTFQTSDMEI